MPNKEIVITVERETFVLKIICVSNFRIKNISLPDSSAMECVYVYFIFACLIFAA